LAVSVITPAVALGIVPLKRIGFGVSKFAWFKMLKSIRCRGYFRQKFRGRDDQLYPLTTSFIP